MTILLTWLLAASVAHAGDKDRDGVKGRHDACPEQAEVINGYRDGDGCPDALGRVTVTVLDLDGQPIEGARVRLGSERATVGADGTAVFADRMPETVVELAVGAPGYVTSTLPDWEIPEGDLTEVVVLDWEPSPVRVTVVDAATRLPMDAAVRWDGPGHIPSERTEADGEVVFAVRPGEWRVRVEADHYQAAEAHVAVARDGAPDQRFALVPNWMRIEERWITFEPGSSDLSPSMRAELDELAGDLFGFPDVSVTIQGHADADDDTLSLRRAQVVRDALVAARVPAERLVVRDLGARVPFDTPWTPEGRAANRAVRFRFVDERTADDPLVGVAVPFSGDSAEPPPDLSSHLAPVVMALMEHPTATVEIEGHRDRSEGALSLERAKAVRDYLIARGVDEARLFAEGLRAVADLDSGVAFRLRSGGETVDLPHEVYFEPGTDRVEAISVTTLREVARLLVKHPVMRVAVRGHASAEEIDEAGRLARERAAAVAAFLRDQGVAADRIVERGFPAEGHEDAARARRVDFVALPPPLLSTERLRFDPGSSDLDDTAEPTLRRVVEAMARHPAVKVQVYGTGVDADGGPKDVVGKLRATRVRERLVEMGVSSSRLVADGGAGDTEEGEVRFRIAGVNLAESLRFGPRSAELDAEARSTIDAMIPTLLLTDAVVRVVGYASPSDGRVILDDLAVARATSVANYLVYAGLGRERIEARGEVVDGGGATARRVDLRVGRP